MGNLIACAAVFDLLLSSAVMPAVGLQWVECSLCLEEQIFISQPFRSDVGGLHCGFDTAEQTLKFCEKLSVFLLRTLDRFSGRNAEAGGP